VSAHIATSTDHSAQPTANRSPHAGLFVRLARAVPPFVIFATLGGLLVWGHRSGWTLPKFSALRGETTAADDWCPEHGVPESVCVECRPELMPRPKAHGWCRDHGVHECPLDHPDVAQLPTRPVVTQQDLDHAARALALTPRVENNSRCDLHKRRIQFATPEAVDKAGVEVEPVWTGPVVEVVSANGEVTYDPTRTARLSARAPGTVFRVFKQVGDPVRAGELVVLVEAAEVGKAKAAFLTAVVQTRLATLTHDRVKRLTGASRQELDQAFAAYSEARITLATAQQALVNLGMPVDVAAFEQVSTDDLPDRLRFLGLPKEVAARLDAKTTTGNLLPVVAPQDGRVATRDVVAGEVVDSAKVLLLVVDARRLWLTLDVAQADAPLVRPGLVVKFRPMAGREDVTGPITWMSTEVSDRTRTVKVRAELDNPGGRLRSNTFGTGRVILREEAKAVVVPSTALHWEGDCHVVFVRDRDYSKPGAPKVFHTRTVRPGVRDGTQVEIIAGVLPGELVVTKGSGVLRAELLRGNLGEG
jgi:cobalt-zinc-cadmium efflux system membrane fusion protein